MTTDTSPSGPAGKESQDSAAGAPPRAVKDLTDLITAMSRTLTRIQQLDAFKDANLGLGEWLALVLIRDSGGAANKHIATAMGITRGRATQIVEALLQARLVLVAPSSGNPGTNVVKVSPAGAAKLADVEAKLQPHLERDDAIKLMFRLRRGVKALLQFFPELSKPARNT